MKTKIQLLLATILFIMANSACERMDSPEDKEGTRLNITLNAEELPLVEYGNSFSNTLLANTIKENENTFISPFSLQVVLNMLANGVSDDVYEEIATVLNNGNATLDQMNSYYSKMASEITKEDDPKVELSLSNSVWVQENLPINNTYKEKINSIYNAPLNTVNFAETAKAASTIDKWADKATKGLIKELELPIDKQTRIVLANALYLSGKWATPFKKKETYNDFFYSESGEKQSVPFMHGVQNLQYNIMDNCESIEMPFGNSSFSMIIALPKPENTVYDVLRDSEWINAERKPCRVELSLPKFTISVKHELKEVLQKLGLDKLFAANSIPGIYEDLTVTFVQQNSYFKIEEEGVEAAAVTSAGASDMAPMFADKAKMDINRPFVFVIRENSTKTALFMGKIATLK